MCCDRCRHTSSFACNVFTTCLNPILWLHNGLPRLTQWVSWETASCAAFLGIATLGPTKGFFPIVCLFCLHLLMWAEPITGRRKQQSKLRFLEKFQRSVTVRPLGLRDSDTIGLELYQWLTSKAEEFQYPDLTRSYSTSCCQVLKNPLPVPLTELGITTSKTFTNAVTGGRHLLLFLPACCHQSLLWGTLRNSKAAEDWPLRGFSLTILTFYLGSPKWSQAVDW